MHQLNNDQATIKYPESGFQISPGLANFPSHLQWHFQVTTSSDHLGHGDFPNFGQAGFLGEAICRMVEKIPSDLQSKEYVKHFQVQVCIILPIFLLYQHVLVSYSFLFGCMTV